MGNLLTQFMPHGHCFGWDPWVFWTHVLGNLLIAFAYFAIPHAMMRHWFKHRGQSRIILPWEFSAFVTCCGVGHINKILVLWWGYYGVAASWDCVTGVVSIYAAYKVVEILLTTEQQRISEAVDVVAQAAEDNALGRDRIQRLRRITRERAQKHRREREELDLLQEVARVVPAGLFVVSEDEHKRLVLDIAGGKALTDAGFDPGGLRGTPVEDVGGTDPKLVQHYRRALEGEAHRVVLSGGYDTWFTPIHVNGRTRVVAFSRKLEGEG